MALKDDVLKIFSPDLRGLLGKIPLEFDKLLEIRLRVNGPLIVIEDNEEYMIGIDGGICTCIDEAYIVTARDIRETMALVSDYSVYAYEDDIRQGFITIKGGHRVGIAGKIVLEGTVIRTIQYISFMNIRLAHQIKGCADKVMPYIFEKGRICHTLIVSPPCCGKTTLLRDMIRQVSEREKGMSIGVVDERSEIAACYLGVPQNDLGIRADVLDGCPKAKGMLMLLRSMSPQLIAVDEIGSREDMEAIEYVIHCGCKLLATVHGNSVDDLMQKPVLGKLVKARIFERYIVLSNREEIGHIEAVYNAFGSNLFLIRAVGAAFVVVGCVGIGFFKSSEITGRITVLKEMHRLLLILKGEISYLAQPVPEAAAQAALRSSGRFRQFFQEIADRLYEKNGETFAKIWCSCIDLYFGDCCLKEEDFRLLYNIGENIGFLDRQTQVQALELYMENLKTNILYLSETAAAKQRVYKCMGAFFGLMAVILLI